MLASRSGLIEPVVIVFTNVYHVSKDDEVKDKKNNKELKWATLFDGYIALCTSDYQKVRNPLDNRDLLKRVQIVHQAFQRTG